jgi:hypothetical protein
MPNPRFPGQHEQITGPLAVFDKFFPIRRALKKSMNALVKSGEFRAARIIGGWLIRFWPDEQEAYFALSALTYKQGQRTLAQEYLVKGVQARSQETFPAAGESDGHILRVRGVQNSVYLLGKSRNGDYKIKLRGGNFGDYYLTDGKKFTVTSYFVQDENLLSDDIPGFDIVLNLISDPDVEAQSLKALSDFLFRFPKTPVINSPDKVEATTRDNNYQMLKHEEGLRFPKTYRFMSTYAEREDCVRFLERKNFSFPLLVREPGTHYGRSFRKIENLDAFVTYVSGCNTNEIYVIQYEDSTFHQDEGRPCQDHLHRKMRVFFVDGKIYPVVCHFDTIWNVHGSYRKEVMLNHDWMMADERSFMDDCETYLGPVSHACLRKLYDIIKLDFFGVDFTVLEDQTVLIFEINPAMRHSYDHADDFPYLLPYLKEITVAFNAMLKSRLQPETA